MLYEVITYLRASGRPEALVSLVEQYYRDQGFFFAPENPEPGYSVVYDIVLDEVVPSLAGPRRPQDLLPLSGVRDDFLRQFETELSYNFV